MISGGSARPSAVGAGLSNIAISRTGGNPRTGDIVQVSEKRFQTGQPLREWLNH
jgi:hypothetical protein